MAPVFCLAIPSKMIFYSGLSQLFLELIHTRYFLHTILWQKDIDNFEPCVSMNNQGKILSKLKVC